MSRKLAATQELQRKDTEIEIERKERTKREVQAQGIANAMEIIRGQLSAMYIQHEAIEAQKQMVNSPNHTVVYIPVGPMGVPLTGTFSATEPRGNCLALAVGVASLAVGWPFGYPGQRQLPADSVSSQRQATSDKRQADIAGRVSLLSPVAVSPVAVSPVAVRLSLCRLSLCRLSLCRCVSPVAVSPCRFNAVSDRMRLARRHTSVQKQNAWMASVDSVLRWTPSAA